MRKTMSRRGEGRDPNHIERGFSSKMVRPKDPAFRTPGRRQGNGYEAGAGELPMAQAGVGPSTLRKIRTSGGGG